jgi:hypothetical protein
MKSTIARYKISFFFSSFFVLITSFQYLRTSYADLKSILDENAQYLQTISSNNLLPYDNLQRLKAEYDTMVEELIDKLRTVDELLEDFLQENDRWTHFNDELKRLETLFREIGSMFDAKMFGERPLEEKQQILEVKQPVSKVSSPALF